LLEASPAKVTALKAIIAELLKFTANGPSVSILDKMVAFELAVSNAKKIIALSSDHHNLGSIVNTVVDEAVNNLMHEIGTVSNGADQYPVAKFKAISSYLDMCQQLEELKVQK